MSDAPARSNRDRIRNLSAKARKADKAIADTAVRLVLEHRRGRPAEACMVDLDRAAREMGR